MQTTDPTDLTVHDFAGRHNLSMVQLVAILAKIYIDEPNASDVERRLNRVRAIDARLLQEPGYRANLLSEASEANTRPDFEQEKTGIKKSLQALDRSLREVIAYAAA